MVLLIGHSGSFPLRGSSLGQAGGCRGLWRFFSRCSSGSARSMGCSVLVLCLHPVLDVPPVLGTTLSLPPQPALLLALLWAGPQILLGLGLLEQTSHSCCLWQLSYARLYSPHCLLCMSSPGPGPGFWVWFVSVWCSGAGHGLGELWGHSPREAVVGFGDHLGKAARDNEGNSLGWGR